MASAFMECRWRTALRLYHLRAIRCSRHPRRALAALGSYSSALGSPSEVPVSKRRTNNGYRWLDHRYLPVASRKNLDENGISSGKPGLIVDSHERAQFRLKFGTAPTLLRGTTDLQSSTKHPRVSVLTNAQEERYDSFPGEQVVGARSVLAICLVVPTSSCSEFQEQLGLLTRTETGNKTENQNENS